MRKNKAFYAIVGMIMLLVSCKDESPSPSTTVEKYKKKERMQITSSEPQVKAEKMVQTVNNVSKPPVKKEEMVQAVDNITTDVQEKAKTVGQEGEKKEEMVQAVDNIATDVQEKAETEGQEREKKVEEKIAKVSLNFEEWRNPFKPFFKRGVEISEEISRPKTPLEKYHINELKLIAIIWGIKKPTAMIEDPDGIGYIVKQGTLVGDNKGRIIKIMQDQIIVEERDRDLLGNSQVKEVALKLHNILEEERSL